MLARCVRTAVSCQLQGAYIVHDPWTGGAIRVCGQPGFKLRRLRAKGNECLKDLRSRWFNLGALPDFCIADVGFVCGQPEDGM